jgi:NAD(P)-dependent dehydrogenase (short-subunit alcohol dehydrogenase family)
MHTRAVFISGASRGIGRATALLTSAAAMCMLGA